MHERHWDAARSHPPAGLNGHDLQIGQTLGRLLEQNSAQTRMAERIVDRLDQLPERIARAIKPERSSSPPRDPLSWKDTIQFALAAAILLSALLGRSELHAALKEAGRAYGLTY